ncbi:MAG: hypothetical protein KA250_10235, partial [Verrucomicrobiales bacterium]|nr:hypothetical protein [Verrucomicrobiales bacterium]
HRVARVGGTWHSSGMHERGILPAPNRNKPVPPGYSFAWGGERNNQDGEIESEDCITLCRHLPWKGKESFANLS